MEHHNHETMFVTEDCHCSFSPPLNLLLFISSWRCLVSMHSLTFCLPVMHSRIQFNVTVLKKYASCFILLCSGTFSLFTLVTGNIFFYSRDKVIRSSIYICNCSHESRTSFFVFHCTFFLYLSSEFDVDLGYDSSDTNIVHQTSAHVDR